MVIMRSLRWLLPFAAAAVLLIACSDDAAKPGADADGEDQPEVAGATTVALSAAAEPLKSFNYDTGLIPADSTAGQVQLKLSAGGGIKIEASGTPSAKGLEGKKGSGKVAVDLHLKLDGRVKSELAGFDGDLPGLKDIDIAIKGESSFDPFLVGAAQEAKVDAMIPAADLPEIPLGGTPGKLLLSVVDGSVLHTTFQGSCVSVAKEKASYAGVLGTSGNVILKATLKVGLAGFEKAVELGQFEVPVPQLYTPLDFTGGAAKGAKDGQDGLKCGGGANASDDGNTATPNTPSSPTSPNTSPGTDPKPDTNPGTEPGTTPVPTACTAMNDGQAYALNLGSLSDNDSESLRTKEITGQKVGGGIDAWYKINIRDEGFNGNPNVRVDIDDPSLSATLAYDCTNLPNSSSCQVGDADYTITSTACKGTKTVELNTSCSSTNDSGIAYVRVHASDNACHSFKLSVFVR